MCPEFSYKIKIKRDRLLRKSLTIFEEELKKQDIVRATARGVPRTALGNGGSKGKCIAEVHRSLYYAPGQRGIQREQR